jgi:hypothetical protein
MPGWNEPYLDNLELRGFVDRTVRMETPSHLLPKICWVGNRGFEYDPCELVVSTLADLLSAKATTAAGPRPSSDDACKCALLIYKSYSDRFEAWFADKEQKHLIEAALRALLGAEFSLTNWPSIACDLVLSVPLQSELNQVMIDHFVQVALYGFQFEKFERAWCEWMNANSIFDWTEVKLQDRVEALLLANTSLPVEKICLCASKILGDYGIQFYRQMQDVISQGKDWTQFGSVPEPVFTACEGTAIPFIAEEKIKTLLKRIYPEWVEVSYKLWMVVDLLSKLRNVYPKATLHDCDEGSDINPVRLNTTALGGS